jgi:hypothetical protein
MPWIKAALALLEEVLQAGPTRVIADTAEMRYRITKPAAGPGGVIEEMARAPAGEPEQPEGFPADALYLSPLEAQMVAAVTGGTGKMTGKKIAEAIAYDGDDHAFRALLHNLCERKILAAKQGGGYRARGPQDLQQPPHAAVPSPGPLGVSPGGQALSPSSLLPERGAEAPPPGNARRGGG